MKNIQLKIMYDGNYFSGWQRLNNAGNGKPSIQGFLEEQLRSLFKEEISLIGSGRTDAGVHAIAQCANFHTESELSTEEMVARLNEMLPDSIRISDMFIVPNEFHSRYDVSGKTYEYWIDTRERASVFTRNYCYPLEQKLNLEAMKSGAGLLIGTHDFRAFCTYRSNMKSTIRTIYDIQIIKENRYRNSEEIKISITGNGFLYHMVRIIAGTLVEIGLNKRTPESIKKALSSGKRTDAGMRLDSRGLYLKNVMYQELKKR